MSEENALPAQEVALTAMPTVDDVIEALKDVIDPELMVNVVDLGLVYGVNIDDEGSVTIDMTLTSPTCPLTDRLEYDTQTALEGIVKSVTINWVWLPPWVWSASPTMVGRSFRRLVSMCEPTNSPGGQEDHPGSDCLQQIQFGLVRFWL